MHFWYLSCTQPMISKFFRDNPVNSGVSKKRKFISQSNFISLNTRAVTPLFIKRICEAIFEASTLLFNLSFVHYRRPVKQTQLPTNFSCWRSPCTQKSNNSTHFTTGGSNDLCRHCRLRSLRGSNQQMTQCAYNFILTFQDLNISKWHLVLEYASYEVTSVKVPVAPINVLMKQALLYSLRSEIKLNRLSLFGAT